MRYVSACVRFFSVSLLMAASSQGYAEPQLYETGPKEESSYVRFVNATENEVAISTGKGKDKTLTTQPDGRATRFFKIKSGTKLAATLKGNGGSSAVEVIGEPWEFITVAVLPDGAKHLKTTLLREAPKQFDSSFVSLGLLNLDAKCSSAVMSAAVKPDPEVNPTPRAYEVKPFAMQRFLIGSDKPAGTIGCGGSGTPVDLTRLEKGERYSLFLLNLKNTRQTFIVNDAKK